MSTKKKKKFQSVAQCFALLPPSIKAWTQLPAHWPSLCVKFFTGCSWFQPVYSGRGIASQQPWGWMEVKKIVGNILGVLTGEYDTVTLWKSPVLPCIIQEASYRRHQMTLISFIYSHYWVYYGSIILSIIESVIYLLFVGFFLQSLF